MALSAESKGAYVARGKWIRGKLEGNSFNRFVNKVNGFYSRHQVSLEFVQIDVERAIKAEGGSNRRDNLGNQTIEIGKTGRGNTELLLADVVNGLIVNLE